MTPERANTVYDVFVQVLQAREAGRQEFVSEMTSASPTSEWRIGEANLLGFGGKYRPERNKVDFYSEDETPELRALMVEANRRLALIDKP